MLRPYLAIAGVLASALLTGCATLLDAGHKPELVAAQKAPPKQAYQQLVTVLKPVRRVPVTVSYLGGAFYRVQVNNTLPIAINLVWDESVYISTTKQPVRLLHLPNRNELPQNPPARQASSLIPPGSQFQADFTGKGWLDCARRNCTPQPRNTLRKAKIYLVFNIKGQRLRWQGEIAFIPPKQP